MLAAPGRSVAVGHKSQRNLMWENYGLEGGGSARRSSGPLESSPAGSAAMPTPGRPSGLPSTDTVRSSGAEDARTSQPSALGASTSAGDGADGLVLPSQVLSRRDAHANEPGEDASAKTLKLSEVLEKYRALLGPKEGRTPNQQEAKRTGVAGNKEVPAVQEALPTKKRPIPAPAQEMEGQPPAKKGPRATYGLKGGQKQRLWEKQKLWDIEDFLDVREAGGALIFSVRWAVSDVPLKDVCGEEALKRCQELAVERFGKDAWEGHAAAFAEGRRFLALGKSQESTPAAGS
ncbi:hypothetical protein NKR23_g11640 [Pleurostoma richardsiae]|uniref:Uncharacterized protein n=1 Tax=Pleurostoma richardsiae TaxID=41990 RepID=A0AA38R9S3_9PEZI|nr:hypothetical protein NKR23_g11640 [Pleurostoma richardsiae]